MGSLILPPLELRARLRENVGHGQASMVHGGEIYAQAAEQRVMTEFYGSYSKERSCWIGRHGGAKYCTKPARLDIVGSDTNSKIFIAVSGPKLDEDGQREDCHTCAAALGLIVLAENGSQLGVVAKNDLFEDFAPYGGTLVSDNAFSVRKLGPQGSYGWLIKNEHLASGAHFVTPLIYGVVGDSVVSLGDVTTHIDTTAICTDTESPEDCTDISGDFVIDANSPANTFYPLVLRASGFTQGRSFEGTYRFVFDERALKYTVPQNMPDELKQ